MVFIGNGNHGGKGYGYILIRSICTKYSEAEKGGTGREFHGEITYLSL